MTEKEKALRLDRALDAALEHMRHELREYYARPTFDECLWQLRQIKSGREIVEMVKSLYRIVDDGEKVREFDCSEQDKQYALAQGAIRIMLAALFQNEWEVTDEQFATDHWQVLFAIEHPEARALDRQ